MLRDTDILLVVDVQNDFLPGGALAVPRGDVVVPIINRLGRRFAHVALTQDWHVPGHRSFASTHANRNPFETTGMPYGEQVTVAGPLRAGNVRRRIRGTRSTCRTPSSSCAKVIAPTSTAIPLFARPTARRAPVLPAICASADSRASSSRGLQPIFAWPGRPSTSRAAGFEALVIEDACRAIDTGGSLAARLEAMRAAAVRGIGLERRRSEPRVNADRDAPRHDLQQQRVGRASRSSSRTHCRAPSRQARQVCQCAPLFTRATAS
jgi:nicotinamidase/pyrazinamidase